MKKLLVTLVLAFALLLPTTAQAQAQDLSPATFTPEVLEYLGKLHSINTVSDVWRYLGAQEWEVQVMQCLGRAESRWTYWAKSATDDYGVMQINGGWFGPRGWFNNTAAPELAYVTNRYDLGVQGLGSWIIYKRSGWRAWTTARYCGV